LQVVAVNCHNVVIIVAAGAKLLSRNSGPAVLAVRV
jgi:hypothetical protein